jgi:hypothetical protein
MVMVCGLGLVMVRFLLPNSSRQIDESISVADSSRQIYSRVRPAAATRAPATRHRAAIHLGWGKIPNCNFGPFWLGKLQNYKIGRKITKKLVDFPSIISQWVLVG